MCIIFLAAYVSMNYMHAWHLCITEDSDRFSGYEWLRTALCILETDLGPSRGAVSGVNYWATHSDSLVYPLYYN